MTLILLTQYSLPNGHHITALTTKDKLEHNYINSATSKWSLDMSVESQLQNFSKSSQS